jgi:hypothetical protein
MSQTTAFLVKVVDSAPSVFGLLVHRSAADNGNPRLDPDDGSTDE